MPLGNPFLTSTLGSDTTFEDAFGAGDFEFQDSVDFTGAVLNTIPASQGGNQGFFTGLFRTAQRGLGFADSTLGLLDGLDLRARRVTGEGFLPDQRMSAGALRLPSLPMIVVLAGVGGAIWLATR